MCDCVRVRACASLTRAKLNANVPFKREKGSGSSNLCSVSFSRVRRRFATVGGGDRRTEKKKKKQPLCLVAGNGRYLSPPSGGGGSAETLLTT